MSRNRALLLLSAACLLPGACKDPAPGGEETEGSTESATNGPGSADTTEGVVQIECTPGEVRCNGQAFIETCAPTGLEWLNEPCGLNEFCDVCTPDETCAADRCIGPCEVEAELPSSAGCSFIANRQLHLNEDSPDGLVVANPNEELVAVVQLYRTPEGKSKEEPVGDPFELDPGTDHLFELDAEFVLGDSSMFRTGGVYRVESDVPVIAYLHSPLTNDRGNDSSLLLPETSLRRDYVVYSYAPHEEQPQNQGEPTYFEIVAIEDGTTVTWTPPVDTAGTGLNIKFVAAGDTSEPLSMNRFDTVRIAASANFQEDADLRDISGTVIHADKPIWVVGASRCSRVPVRDDPELGRCDPLQELLIPLDYWGSRYVAAHSPLRDSERHYWRIYSAGGSGGAPVRITTAPQVLSEDNCTAPSTWDGTGCSLAARGAWIEVDVPNGTNFFIEGDGPFMPVQYLQSSRHQTETPLEFTELGDPAMYQMVPVEQFLNRYVFSTGRGFDFHYVQVIREQGGASVFLDETQGITNFTPVGSTYEVANLEITEGAHLIESGTKFGIVQFGYSSDGPSDQCNNTVDEEPICHASYAYPGGMNSLPINIP